MGKRKKDGLKPGEYFQNLVKIIEAALHESDNVTIESPAFLRSKLTGDLREHDVLIKHELPLRTVLASIECKDWKNRVDVKEVEAFHTKCEATGIHVPVIASRSGFSKGALKSAEQLGIRTVTALDTIDSRRLFEFIGHRIETEVKRPSIDVQLSCNLPGPHTLWQILPSGEHLDITEDRFEFARLLLRDAHCSGAMTFPDTDQLEVEGQLQVRLTDLNRFYIMGSNGLKSALAKMEITYDFVHKAIPLETEDIDYRDVQSGRSVRAVRFMESGKADERFLYLEHSDGTLEVRETGIPPKIISYDESEMKSPADK